MSQVTPATSLRRCGSGERWLSIHMNSSESPIHMMPAMTWIHRSSRLSHSRSVASMPFRLLAAHRGLLLAQLAGFTERDGVRCITSYYFTADRYAEALREG